MTFACLHFYFVMHTMSNIGRGRLGDFRHFYYATLAMRRGADVYASWHRGYLYPPLWAFLIQPIGELDIQGAARVQAVCNCLALLSAVLLASREALRRITGDAPAHRVFLVAAVVTGLLSGPLRAEIEMGQTNSWILLALVAALMTVDRRPTVSGILLAFAFNIKFQAIGFLPYLLIRRRFKAAGGFVLGAVAFSLLPALTTGWSTNLHNLATAYSGILDLVGIKTGVAAKNPMGVSFSLSISSTMARWLGAGREPAAWMLSAGILGTFALAALLIYRRCGFRLFACPPAAEQAGPPWSKLVAWEWAGIVVLALTFSPQTNSRHLVQLTILAALGAAQAIASERRRYGAIAGLVVLFVGISFPPGSEATRHAVVWWRENGFQAWAICVCYAMLLWAGVHSASRSSATGYRGEIRADRDEPDARPV